jgi:hypothetical protein
LRRYYRQVRELWNSLKWPPFSTIVPLLSRTNFLCSPIDLSDQIKCWQMIYLRISINTLLKSPLIICTKQILNVEIIYRLLQWTTFMISAKNNCYILCNKQPKVVRYSTMGEISGGETS